MNTVYLNDNNEIEFHFFLKDQSHEIDAKLLHLWNGELITVIETLCGFLDLPISIKSTALSEGGIRQLWKIFGENSGQLGVILAAVAIIMTAFPQSKDLSDIEKRNFQLQNEKLQIEIEQLKKIENSKDLEESAITEISQSHEISIAKSKFYESLNSSQVIEKIEYSILSSDKSDILTSSVLSSEFVKYIRNKEQLPDITDEQAKIELIAPVLIDTKYKWKGIYDGSIIDFYMNDDIFKDEIKSGVISFQAGTELLTKLVTRRKIDEGNYTKISSYAVEKVYSVKHQDSWSSTISGKNKRREDKEKASQKNLDFDSEGK